MSRPWGSPAPAVSVIIPVWNVEGHVGACLGSLAAQEFGDFEAIVVDDGSTDASRARAQAAVAGDARFRIIVQPNRGLGTARNAGLARARGTFVAFVDSDDRVAPEYLARLHRALLAGGADWAACALRYGDPDGSEVTHPAIHGPLPDGAPVPGMAGARRLALRDWGDVARHYPSAWNKLYRRALIGEIRFDEGLWYEDHAFFWQLAARTDHLLWLPEPLYLQTQGRAGQITGDGGERVFEQIAVFDRLAAIAAATDRPGAGAALARLVPRLGWERARRLRDPDRIARFAAACRDWLARHGLTPDPGPGEVIPPDWIARLAGRAVAGAPDTSPGAPVAPDAGTEASAVSAAPIAAGPPQPGTQPTPQTAMQVALQPPPEAPLPRTPVPPRPAGAVSVRRAAPPPPPPTAPARGAMETAMLSFCTRDGATLAFDVDFRSHGYANLSFFDAGGADILFHLSLRQRDWLAVCNRRIGPDWEAERAMPVMLEPTGDRVELRFPAPDRVEILINGEALCTHQGVFDRLDEITAMDVHGGVGVEGMAMTGPHNADRGGVGALHLAGGMRVTGWACDPRGGAVQRLALSLAGGAATLPLQGHALPELAARLGLPTARIGLAMVLPGRVWQAVPGLGGASALPGAARTGGQAEEPEAGPWDGPGGGAVDGAEDGPATSLAAGDDPALRIQAISNGLPCGAAISLRRSAVLAWVEAMAAQPPGDADAPSRPDTTDGTTDATTDTTALLTALEHVRFAGLWPELSAEARAMLRRTAQTLGVTEFLPALAAGAPAAPEAPGAAAAARLDRRLAQLRRRVARDLHAAPGADPAALLAGILQAPLPAVLRRDLCLSVTETFCTRNAFPALVRLMETLRIPRPAAQPAEDAWAASLALPFAYLRGDTAAMRALLLDLARPLPGWICTGTLAWVVRDAVGVRSVTLEAGAEADLIQGFLAVLERQARDPDGRAACVELIGAMVALLCAAPRLPDDLGDEIEAAALRVHGLSRVFWQRVAAACDAGRLVPGPRLQAAREAFGTLAARAEDRQGPDAAADAAADTALRLFTALGCHDALRVRLDLFGPSGLPPGADAAGMAGLIAAGLDPAEMLLRRHAAPGAGPVPAPLHPVLRAAVAERMPVARLPMEAVAERASRRAAALLVALAEGHAGRPGGSGPEDVGPQDMGGRDLQSGQAQGGNGQGGDAATADLDGLIADIAALGGVACRFLGLGLGLRLLHGLLRLGAVGPGERVLAGLDAACRALSAAETAALAQAPAVRSGLWGLRRFEAAGLAADPDAAAVDLAGQALTLFAPALEGLEGLANPDETEAGAQAGMGPDDAAALALDPRAPLFDTLVVVMSCRAHLADRIPVLQAGWLARLEALGVPWVVAVGRPGEVAPTGAGAQGEGETGAPDPGQLAGRLLELDAPDHYEGLPLKTLALFDWVRARTGFAHVLKIDDDCLMDPEALFHAHSHTTAAYHGRRIERRPGDMDRSWHIGKSDTDRGRLEIDKSPEPSIYCDGGAAYALDRRALAALRAVLDSAQGQFLVSVSLMEDKLVGDLLAQAGVVPEDTGHRVAVHRRLRPGGVPAPRWSNAFLPGPASGVRIAHLDSIAAQGPALAGLEDARLRPPKVWPTARPVRLGYNSNALTLLSPPERLAHAAEAPVAVVACLRNEALMLPMFLEHYRRMGVEGFLIVDNMSDDGTLEFLCDQPDVAVFSADTDYAAALYGVAWQQALLAQYRPDRWTLVADADELLLADLDRRARLPDLLAGPDFAGAEAVRLFLLDMYPRGPLAQATFAGGDPFAEAGHVDREPFLAQTLGRGPYSDAPTWTSALRHRLFPGARPDLFVAQKIALLRYRPWMRLSAGLHYVADARLAGRALCLAHFKYHAGFHARARAEVARAQHFNAAEEYRSYLDLMEAGRAGLFDPAVSVPWRDCAFLRATLEGAAAG